MHTFSRVKLLLILVIAAMNSSAQFGVNDIRSAAGNLSQYLMSTIVSSTEGGKLKVITAFNNTENTVGKRFLFDQWATGDSIITPANEYLSGRSYLFNYDKLTGSLLVTQDKINIMAAFPSGINSFILEKENKKYKFGKLTQIDATKFSQVLASSNTGYSLYKISSVKFVKSNFRDDGLMQSGNRYDEYKEESEYYLVDETTKQVRVINFKPKVIKAVLFPKKDQAEQYFKTNKEKKIDEDFLVELINYVNSPVRY